MVSVRWFRRDAQDGEWSSHEQRARHLISELKSANVSPYSPGGGDGGAAWLRAARELDPQALGSLRLLLFGTQRPMAWVTT